jgi:hypothetical protein
VFRFFVQELLAKLGTPLAFRFCYISSVCSDQGADLGQHVWGLDKYMADDVGKLSLKFFDPATRFILHLPAGLGTKCVHLTL